MASSSTKEVAKEMIDYYRKNRYLASSDEEQRYWLRLTERLESLAQRIDQCEKDIHS